MLLSNRKALSKQDTRKQRAGQQKLLLAFRRFSHPQNPRKAAQKQLRSRYLIISADGRKRHIDREERDQLLLSGVLQQIGPQEYRSTLKPIRMRSLQELEQLKLKIEEKSLLRHFLPGSFVFEQGDKRHREMLETVEAMVLRLRNQGQLQAA